MVFALNQHIRPDRQVFQSSNDIKKEEKDGEKSSNYPSFAGHLKVIRGARNHLMMCFSTFPLYVWGIVLLLNNGHDITWMMLAYMALYAAFGINASVKRCPRCHGQFFVKKYFLNPLRRSCAHCGLSFDHIHGDPV